MSDPDPSRVAQARSGPPLLRLLWPATALVSLLGLLAELGEHVFGMDEGLAEVFSLSYEANLPTWASSVLLFGCAAALSVEAAEASRRRERARFHWWLLTILFLYLSLDEAIEIHEHAAFFDTGGVLYFSWVIPAAAVVAVLGLAYLPFLRDLPPPTRRRFVLAGLLYVGGALGMELPLGWWTENMGDDNLGYGLIDWVEETLELVGIATFLLAVRAHRRARPDPGGAEAEEAEG